MHYSKGDSVRLEELIAADKPDVVAIQEWPGADYSALNAATGWHIHKTPRLFLASRHPIRQAVELGHHSMGEQASAARYQVDMPAGPVHVFSLHTATTRQGITDTIHENRKGPQEVRANSARRRAVKYVAGRAASVKVVLVWFTTLRRPHLHRGMRRVY